MRSTLVFVVTAFLALASKDKLADFNEAMNKFADYDGLRSSESLAARKARFQSFLKFSSVVDEINSNPASTFRAANNFLSILTEEERGMYLGRNSSGSVAEYESDAIRAEEFVSNNAPSSRDWRGTLPPVKNQRSCGSCWTFGAAAAMEGAVFFATGKKVPLSEQEYTDCGISPSGNGCNGGWEYWALQYSQKYDRIASEKDVPYTAKYNSGCRNGNKYANHPNALKTLGVQVVSVFGASTKENRNSDADQILVNILSTKVASVGVYVTGTFQAYSSGIFDDSKCQRSANHAVGAVGYGTEGGRPYWLIRNSWGSGWGDGGYIKMNRARSQICGIPWTPTYPVMKCRSGSVCKPVNPDDADGNDDGSDGDDNDGNNDEPCFEKKVTGNILKGRISKAANLDEAKIACQKRSDCKGVYKKGKRFYLTKKTETKPSRKKNFYMMRCKCKEGLVFCNGKCQHEHFCK